jgi:hypothetical protein
MSFKTAVRRACALWLLFLGSNVAVADQQGSPSGFELRRGVVVDAATAYLGNPSGGIAAVDLTSGRELWSSDDAALPLALLGPLLVTQVEEIPRSTRLRIVVFDVSARGRKVVKATIPLPDDVYAIIADELERSFRATAERDDNGITVSWSYTERQVRGMSPDDIPPAPRIVMGAAHIDLATGQVARVSPRRVVADAVSERLIAANGLTQTPWRAGGILATTEGGRGGPLFLRRWDALTGEPLPDRQLLKKALVALASADRGHLLATERVGTGGAGDPEYRWAIFHVETGALAGELRRDISASPFVLAKEIIVFEAPAHGLRIGETWVSEPLKLRGVRLSTGVPIWDRELRDLRYRGKVPPGLTTPAGVKPQSPRAEPRKP